MFASVMGRFSYRRSARIGELLKKEISQVLREQVKDPRIGFVTLTDAEVTEDLRSARIWVSVYGSDEEKRASIQGLNRAAPFLRRCLGEVLDLKRIPALEFCLDRTLERAARIERLLSELREEGELGGPGDR